MKTIQITAKNVQKAIEQGLKELGVSQEEVDIKILDEGGLFRKAKIELCYEDGNIAKEKSEKKAEDKDKKEESKAEKKEEKSKEKAEKKEPIEQEKTDNKESIESAGKDFLNKLLEKMRVQAEIDFAKTEDGVLFNASGD